MKCELTAEEYRDTVRALDSKYFDIWKVWDYFRIKSVYLFRVLMDTEQAKYKTYVK